MLLWYEHLYKLFASLGSGNGADGSKMPMENRKDCVRDVLFLLSLCSGNCFSIRNVFNIEKNIIIRKYISIIYIILSSIGILLLLVNLVTHKLRTPGVYA